MIGETLGRFRVVERIGSGGMGDVYRAHDEHLDRDVALKVLPKRTLLDQGARKRFHKEALTLAKLRHEHIGAVYDFGSEDEVEFLVMELIPGADLSAKIGDGPLPENEVLRIGIQIAEALEEAHEQQIVHLDLKPQNIMVTPKGQAKVLDFGLARLIRPVDEASTAPLSEVQSVAGTLPYMAPEQLREGAEVDARTDVHALGATLYEMATGTRPFPQTDASKLITAVLHTRPAGLRDRQGHISSDLERVVLKALEKDPTHRYQTVQELREDLERCRAHVPVAAPLPGRRLGRRRAALGVAIATLLALVIGLDVGGLRSVMMGRSDQHAAASVAVLPFANYTGDPSQEYFADGLTEEMTMNLARLSGVTVKGRQSVLRFKGSDLPLSEIAAALEAQAIVQGSLMRRDERIQVNVQLLDAVTGEILWGDRLERDEEVLPSLLNEATLAIVGGLGVVLDAGEEAWLASAPIVDPEAYDAYSQGRSFLLRYTPEDHARSMEYFERAIEIDSTYAPAYAGIAQIHLASWWASDQPITETLPKAKAAAHKALAIDSTLAEAHLALAWGKALGDWDWEGADQSFRQAIELDPGSPLAHEYYGVYLMNLGYYEEAIHYKKRAQELDTGWTEQGWAIVYIYQGRFEEARAPFEQMVQSLPNWYLGHALLGQTYLGLELYEEALAEFEKALELHESAIVLAILAYANGIAGKAEQARMLNERMDELASRTYVSPVHIAVARIGIGQIDEALDAIERGLEVRDTACFLLPAQPLIFDSLRSNPRFQELLGRMNLPTS